MSSIKISGVVLLLFIVRTNCFNIENRKPIVKRGLSGSYFGYSVALHKTENNSDIRSSWLLVGAPLGQNLQPDTNRSGALFKCPLTDFQSQTDCIQVPTDGRRSSDFEYEDIVEKAPSQLRVPGNDEIKNDQWMGVNVRSQGPGGKVMVCAHRYIWSQNLDLNQYGLGLCYSLNNYLDWEEQWEPCKGRPMLLEHQQFGYCQAGTSLALLEDGTALIGSPGPYTWRGTIFVLSISDDFLSRDKTVYLGPLNDKPKPINKYSYLGMSVSAGKFFAPNKTSYAAGAPRAEENGQVYIFNKHNSEPEMDIKLVITGEQFASNFGYELLSADFNNDGYDDLLVSAPFYFKGEVGGGVYIYYNIRGCTADNCKYDAVLRGKLESRFGISLASLGDINKDGHLDLAVGAPYEGTGCIYIYLGSENGISTSYSQKLHGWEGTKSLGYSLSGGIDMDNNGYPDLLAGAFDSDVIILFRTRSIIDIKTAVTGKELKNINTAIPGCEKDPNTHHKCFSFKACFTIKSAITKTENITIKSHIKEVFEKKISRVWFQQEDPNIKHNYQIRYFTLLPQQIEYCQEESVYFPNTTRDILSPIKFQLNYTIANNEPHSAILNQTSIKDFQATFQKDCGSDDLCQSKMIMNARLLLNETDEKQYILNVGHPDEFVLEASVTNEGDPAYEAKLFVFYPLTVRYIDVVNRSKSFKCSDKNETVLFCDLGNPLPANKSVSLQLRFEIKESTNQSSRIYVENELQFLVLVNSTSEELSNQTSVKLAALVSRKAEIKLTTPFYTKTVVYSGEIKGGSAMKTFDDVGSTVWHSYQIQHLGPISLVDLEVAISWPWQVGNIRPEGKWLLYIEDVNITDGRKEDRCYTDPENAINIRNLTKLTIEALPPAVYTNGIENASVTVQMSPNMTSNQELLMSSFSSSNTQENEVDDDGSFIQKLIRKRRETDYVVPSEIITGKDGKKRKVVIMDCKADSAKCITIYCEFPKYPKGRVSTIVVKSRLWNSTFVEDYSQVDWVRIMSYGNVTILDPTIEQHERSQPSLLIETNAYPDLSIQLESGVPLWIIILAVVAGLILLIILILVLWIAGFFKRNRIKDPTLSGNLTRQSEQETLLNK